ncbi:MAG: hypothetical protein Q9175_002239 [Cornicularia normoerica]
MGFLVSTISKMDEKVEDIRECKTRLRSFYWQLQEVHLQLTAWRWIWIGKKAFPHETYVHFWGIEGLKAVEWRSDDIIFLSFQIGDLLRQPVIGKSGQSLPRSELSDWHCLIVNLVRKIGFTLFRNTSLSEKIGRLKRDIEGLKDFSQHTFRLRQQSDPNLNVTPSELHCISGLKDFVDRISTFGSLLYNSRLPSLRLEWAIELGPPEAGYALDLWSEVDRMYIDFFVRDTAVEVQTKASRVRMCVEEQSAHKNGYVPFTVQRVNDVVLSHGRREDHSEYDRYFDLLEKPSRRSRSFKKKLAEGITLAEVALALPISVKPKQEDTCYLVGGEPASRKQLLGMLRDRFGRNTITKAISYCLDPHSCNLGETLRPDHLGQYCQNIVLPLQTYHKIVNKHSQSAGGERLRGNECLSRYLEGSKHTKHNENGEEDFSDFNEEEDGNSSNDNEDSFSHGEDEHGDSP